MPLRPPLFPAFCLAEHPHGLWVAEAGDAVVGFGFSWMSQKFWCLAQLFVRPETQAKGAPKGFDGVDAPRRHLVSWF